MTLRGLDSFASIVIYSDVTLLFPSDIKRAALADWLPAHPAASVDFIHGEDAVAALCADGTAAGVLLPPFAKEDIFRGVVLGGVLPRKTFSMGHARDKRYYLECRRILPGDIPGNDKV